MRPQLREVISASLGKIPLTLMIENTSVVNVFTGEIIDDQCIGIYKDSIVYVGNADPRRYRSKERLDVKGKVAIPGLIDTHLHIESSMVVPSRFAEAVLPHGTTTVFADPHEIVNVFGKLGLSMTLDNSRNVPMKIFYLAPSCVPESSAVTSGARIDSKDVAEMLDWEGVKGLAEVMDYPALLSNNARIRQIVEVARNKGVVIDGHAPLLQGADLCAYISTGVEADHENFDTELAIEKLRQGMYLKLRGPDILNPKEFVAMIQKLPRPWNLIFVTDDVMPDRLLELGHLDHVCRSFIRSGMDPVEVVRSATLRPAQHMRMPSLGAIAPGKSADIVLMGSLSEFVPDLVVSNGELVASAGKMIRKVLQRKFGRSSKGSVHVRKLTEKDFEVNSPIKNGSANVNCIEFAPGLLSEGATAFLSMVLTNLGTLRVEIRDGIPTASGLSFAFVFERHGLSGRRAFAFVHNLIQRGAFATTVSHDSHNLTVVGTNANDMLQASECVQNAQGGVAAVKDGKLLAQIKLPVAGLMSEEPLEKVALDMKKTREAFRAIGMIDHPYMPIPFLLTLSVIPHARITDRGLFDVDSQRIIPAFAG